MELNEAVGLLNRIRQEDLIYEPTLWLPTLMSDDGIHFNIQLVDQSLINHPRGEMIILGSVEDFFSWTNGGSD